MRIYVSGALAYDRIMDFKDRFSEHIMSDKIHVLNVCFNVDSLQENLGGTAGNTAYGLAQLGERPHVLACLGHNGSRYPGWMTSQGIDVSGVRTVAEEFTAWVFITTDLADKQTTGFNNLGAMKQSCGYDMICLDPSDSMVIVASGNLEDMAGLPAAMRRYGVPFIFDPGQSLNIFNGPQLQHAFTGARLLISNDYELEMIRRMAGLDLAGILGLVGAVITTRGDQGSLLHENGHTWQPPAAPAAGAQDYTGAGDAFLAGLLKGLALPEACLWGANLLSYAVACYDTQKCRLDPAEFQARLQTARPTWPLA